jgi:hypothetical protein
MVYGVTDKCIDVFGLKEADKAKEVANK